MIKPSHLIVAAALWVTTLQAATTELPSLLNETNKLLKTGDMEAAYTTLAAHESRLAGNPKFDLMLGIAALRSERTTLAVYALERVIDIEPNNARARAELAQAYYKLGENRAAKNEFDIIKDLETLPSDVKSGIEKYLAAIDYRFDARRTQLGYYFETSSGTDSNVNSATDASRVPLPVFANLNLLLSDTARETDSPFVSLGGGLRFNKPLRSNLMMYAKANLDMRETFDADEFATRVFDGNFGFSFLRGSHQYHIGVVNQNFAVDDSTYRNFNGINSQWHYLVNSNNSLSTFIQYAQLKYPSQRLLDTDQTSAGFAWIHSFDKSTNAALHLGLYLGTDNEVSDLNPEVGRDFIGLRTGTQIAIGRVNYFAALNYISSEYGAANSVFLITREDDYIDFNTGININFKKWQLQPSLRYTSNDSNIVLHEFDRTQVLMTARINF